MKEERKLQLKLLQKTHKEPQKQQAAWFWDPACAFSFFAYNQITRDNRKSAQAQIIPVYCDSDGKTAIKQKNQSGGFTWSEICSVNRIKSNSLMLQLFAKTSSWRLHPKKKASYPAPVLPLEFLWLLNIPSGTLTNSISIYLAP